MEQVSHSIGVFSGYIFITGTQLLSVEKIYLSMFVKKEMHNKWLAYLFTYPSLSCVCQQKVIILKISIAMFTCFILGL